MAPPVCARARKFQNLAKQHQHGDDRRGFKVDGNRAAHFAKAFGKKAGRQYGEHAVA